MAKVKVSVGVGLAGCIKRDEIEIPDEELEGLEGDERENVIAEYAKDWMYEQIDWDFEEI